MKSIILRGIAPLFPISYFMLIHSKMMCKFMPDGLRNDLCDWHTIFFRGFFNRYLIERYRIGQSHPDAVQFSSFRQRNSLVESEKRFIVSKPLLLSLLLQRLVFYQQSNIPYLLPHPLRQAFEALFY